MRGGGFSTGPLLSGPACAWPAYDLDRGKPPARLECALIAPHGSLSLRRGSHPTPTADGRRVGTGPPFSAGPLLLRLSVILHPLASSSARKNPARLSRGGVSCVTERGCERATPLGWRGSGSVRKRADHRHDNPHRLSRVWLRGLGMRSDKDLAKAKMKVAVALGEHRAAESRRESDARREQLRRALGRLKRQMGKR